MKKLLLVSALIILGALKSFASHAMSAEITYTHISGDDYLVQLIVYNDCASTLTSGANQTMTFSSASCGINFDQSMPLISETEVSQLCDEDIGNSTCNGGTEPGTLEFVYQDTITLPPCTDWILHWDLNARNGAITNLVNPQVTMYIENTLNNVIGANNNSPKFTTLPTPYLCVNQLKIYNHGASDADGDSLYYSFSTPLTGNAPPAAPMVFNAGWSQLDPVQTVSGMNLNQETGEMCFTPSIAQFCVVSIVIEEYRNNILIGSQIREMQIVVSNTCTSNNAPSAGGVPVCGGISNGVLNWDIKGISIDSIAPTSYVMCPDDTICFTVPFSDLDPGDSLILTHNIASAIPGATATIIGNNTENVSLSFCWVPTPLDSGINVFSVEITDDACPINASTVITFDITIFDQPYAGEDQIICGDQEAQLQAVGGGGYIWSVISGDTDLSHLSCTNCSDPLVNPAVTTTYLLTSTQAAACENTDTVTVFRVPDFDPEAYGDTALCDYLSHQIGVNILSGPAGTYTYLWNNGLTLSNDSIANPIASPTGTTVYIVEVESPDGCVKQEDTVTIIVTPPPTTTMVPGDTAICQGGSLNFDVSLAAINDDFNTGYDASIWNNVSGATVGVPCVPYDGTALNFDAATRELVTNSINVTNCTTIEFCLWIANDASSGACENADLNEDVVLNYNTGAGWVTLQTYVTGDWDAAGPYANSWQCFSVTIPAAAQTPSTAFQWAQIGNYGATLDHWSLDNISISCGGSTAYTYNWAPATDLSATNISNPVLSNASATTDYTVTITDIASGCSIDRNQIITVVPDYTLASTQSDTNICLGDTINFETIPSVGGSYSYSWSPAGIMDNDTVSNPTATFMTPGENTVVVTVNSAGGCIKTDTFTVNVSYGFQPDITMVPDTALICGGDSAWLNIDLGGGIPGQCGASPSTACSGASTQLTVGTNSGANTTTSYPAPYANWYRNAKHQFLYTAAELNAMGFNGGKITEIAWEITQINGTTTYNDYQIKMGCTSTTNLTTWESGLTQVLNPVAVNIVVGVNTHVLDVAYEWDGVSNLVVEICYDNLATSFTNNSITPWTTTTFTSSIWYRSDSAPACPSTTSTGTGSNRPVTMFTTCPTTPDSNLYYYAWTPSLGLSSDSVKTPLVHSTGPTTYYVTVTDTLGGCFDTDSVFVTIGDDFTVTATGADTVCIHNGVAVGVPLGASINQGTGETYVWNNAATLSDPFIPNPMAFPTVTTDYIVTVTNPSGCVRTDTVTITVNNIITPTIMGDTTYCEGLNTELSVGVYDTYSWSPNGETTSNIFATNGSYYVTVTLGNCTVNSDTVNITEIIITPPVLSDTTFCENDAVTIDAGPGFTSYNWIPTGGTNQIGSFNVEGNYAVIVGELGCTDTSNTVFVKEISNPSPVIVGDTNYCGTGGTALSVNNVYNSYNWSTSSVTNTTTAFAVNGGPTTITLTVDSLGCTSTVSVDITNPQANPQIIIPSAICPDSTIEVTASPLSFSSYAWSNGSGATSTVVGPGPITLTVEKDGCTFEVTETVQSFPLPVADFTIAPATSGQPNIEILFTDASYSAGSIANWIWDFDATNSTSASGNVGEGPLTWIYNAQGTYTITLTVIDNNGCQHSTSQDYLIFTDIVSPNIITPNGDGLNDFLVFENLDISVFSNNLTVFNRWGNEVFQQNDYQNNWNGGDLSDGTYFYILEINYADGPETFKGSLNILR